MSRVAVVTGGASGMGLGAARHLRDAGNRVAILDLGTDRVGPVADREGFLGIVCDVSDRVAVDAAMGRVRSELGPVQILVTSAGIEGTVKFLEMSFETWQKVIDVNLNGTFHCIQSALPDMVEAGWGRIVTISSSSAQSGAPDRAHYIASKGGVIALTKAISYDFAPLGITCNTIPPSIIDTPMAREGEKKGSTPIPLDMIRDLTPVRRLGTADDIGATVAFLCSDAGGFITGQQIGVNGGWYV